LLLEYAVAQRVAQERPDWRIEPAGVYLRAPEHRLGATPDFTIHDDPRGVGILQTKLSITGVFDRMWRDDEGNVTPPMWIRLQALTEAMLWGAKFGVIACYIDHPFRNDVHIFEFDRHPGAEAAILSDVAQFWHDVEWEIEPEPSGSVDAELVKLMYPEHAPLTRIDLSGDNYLADALTERSRLKEQIKAHEERIEEIETELKAKMRNYEMASFNGFVVTHRTIDREGFTVRPTRYRKLNIADIRPKEIDDDGKPPRF
ncbi:MAG: endonuclease, partial [Bradyrhizobium sp.]